MALSDFLINRHVALKVYQRKNKKTIHLAQNPEIRYLSAMKKVVIIAIAILAAMSCGRQGSESSSAVSFDNGLGNAYLVLKARAMGFDTLIMGMRDSGTLRTLFGIPDGEEVMAVIALGHRASDPVKPTRKPLDEIAKFF